MRFPLASNPALKVPPWHLGSQPTATDFGSIHSARPEGRLCPKHLAWFPSCPHICSRRPELTFEGKSLGNQPRRAARRRQSQELGWVCLAAGGGSFPGAQRWGLGSAPAPPVWPALPPRLTFFPLLLGWGHLPQKSLLWSPRLGVCFGGDPA